MYEIDAVRFPHSAFFLQGYLSKEEDPTNFPPDTIEEVLSRYETIFENAINTLGSTKELLKRRTEFDFDSGDRTNLEGGIAIFRTIQALKLRGFSDFTLISPRKGKKGADILCAKEGKLICVEVKAITKQAKGRQGQYLEGQLYEKIRESAENAARQLKASEDELSCSIKIFAPVFNWFDQTIHLDESDLNRLANRLEESGDVPSIDVFDAIFFINKMGNDFLFLSKSGQIIWPEA